MTSKFLLFLSFSTLTILSIVQVQGRSPHGLTNEKPVAFSPSTYDFFHPTSQRPYANNACDTSNCSPLPISSKIETTEDEENLMSTPNGKTRYIGAGGIAGIMFGLGILVLIVFVARQTNSSRFKPFQTNV